MEHKFINPPVAEFVCALQFKDRVCDLPIISTFYEKIKSEYPKITEYYPFKRVEIELGQILTTLMPKEPIDSLIRYWFHKKNGERLIQLQDNFYALNWRKRDNANNVFPSYHIFYKDFKEYYEMIFKIVNGNNKQIILNGCELTYVDYIDVNELGINIGRIDEIFEYFNFKQKGIIENISGFNFSYSIKMNDLGGNYIINYQTAKDLITKKDLINVQTSIVGKLTEKYNNIDDWFQKANNILVDEFVHHLTNKTKEKWGYSYV